MDSIRQALKLEEASLQFMRSSSNGIRRGNMGTHHPSKEQAGNRTNRDGKEYVKHHIPGKKINIWVREKTKVADMIKQVRRRQWTWAGHVSRTRENRWISRITTWKMYEMKRPRGRPARRWTDELDDYWKGTIWQKMAQNRLMWKQYIEAFAQIAGLYGCTMMMIIINHYHYY